MTIWEWWPRLDTQTQAWLTAHNGEALPPMIQVAITLASSGTATELTVVEEDEGTVTCLSDDATDWIEEFANGEEPAPPPE